MFYDKFKLLCDRKGVSCNKAATDMGLSNSTPTKWKKTGATPDGTTLAKISAYFGVSVGELLTNESTGAIEFTVSTEEMQDYLQSKKKAPTGTGERMSDDDLKVALFGSLDVDNADLDDVKRYAAFIRDKKRGK